ncbi:RNA polymerase sigma factor [Modestobacter italicus]|uniref:RNA polymerase sigma factor n=1 Tax=Modestobacter italicus (strain DSM 44449 / CECT 9708 / BC 501) TaxID=2732864 RepID=UPI001C978FEA|nr:RNA polymerase sigma factor [Modestobacter italicus]
MQDDGPDGFGHAEGGHPDDAAFARFVADHRPGLLRTAVLLTGDRADAEELVQRALTRVRRSWPRDDDPLTTARRALVRGATGRLRSAGAQQVIESLPGPGAPTAPAGDPGLQRALRDLPPRARAAAVLAELDGLDDAALARVLGGAAEPDRATGTARLRAALRADPYRREQPTGVHQLREELHRLAGATGRWQLDAAQATADVGHRRSRTRRRVLAAAGVAAVALAGAVGTGVRDAPDTSVSAPPVEATASGDVPPGPAGARAVPVLAGPTRGSLAGDAAFVDAVRQVGWGALEAPAPADRTVVLATDTPDGRVALVVGTVEEDFRGVWLTGAPGAAADQLTPRLPRQLGRTRPVTLLLGGPGPASLVVVAAPGDRIEVSDRLLTGPRGTVGREWSEVPAADGVAVVPARTVEDGPALSVRVSRDGRLVHRGGVDWPGDRPGRTVPLPVLTALRPGSTPADPRVVDAALVSLAVPLGTEPAALRPQLLWSGELPLSRGPGTVAVVAVQSPGGARVVTTWAGSGGGALACGTQTPPGSTPLETVTVARVCEVDLPGLGPPRDSAWLVVSAPPTVATAELLDADGGVIGPLALQAGSAVTQLPADARTVRTLFPNGAVAAETPIAPPAPEPFGDFGPGPVS